MGYFLKNNCHLNLSPANNFRSDIYTSNNYVKMTIGYSTPVHSALNAFQARECNSAGNCRINTNIEYILIVNFPWTKAMHISASRTVPNFTTVLGPIHIFVNLIIRADLSIL